MIKKGKFTKCMGCQFEKEECDEVKFEKCSFEITKPTCHRKKCCSLAKSGDNIREISCNYQGEEECVESTYTQCHMKKTREHCERKRCCLYGKKGDVVKKN